jgi:hypothetical protein
MKQNLIEEHLTDERGFPTGGYTAGTGFEIEWQNGPLGRDEDCQEPNGAFVEGLVQAALGRLQFYQGSDFACRENVLAITKLEEALHWMQHRTDAREAAGVEGTHQK